MVTFELMKNTSGECNEPSIVETTTGVLESLIQAKQTKKNSASINKYVVNQGEFHIHKHVCEPERWFRMF